MNMRVSTEDLLGRVHIPRVDYAARKHKYPPQQENSWPFHNFDTRTYLGKAHLVQ